MKKTIIRISTAMALLMLTPYVGSNIVKADDTDNVVNGANRSGSVVGSMQISADVTVYYVQDDQTSNVYPYASQNGTVAFNINDKVQFDLCYSTSCGKILIKSIIRK